MSAPAVVATAMLQCSFGMAPSTLSVLPIRRVMVEGRPVAAIADIAPMVNVAPFGMCSSLANPTVAAATAAAASPIRTEVRKLIAEKLDAKPVAEVTARFELS